MNQMQHDFVGGPVAQDYGELIGTPFKVFLSNGVVEGIDEKTGKVMTDIVDLPGLIASILRSRVLHPRKLSGDDLKYIRSALHVRSSEIAEILEITPEHYSRCETGVKTLSSSSEKHYRMHVFLETLCKNIYVHKKISEQEQKPECSDDNEKAKEAMEAFQKIFSEMKIQHIFDAGEELAFSFGWRSRSESSGDCENGDGKWQNEHKEAA